MRFFLCLPILLASAVVFAETKAKPAEKREVASVGNSEQAAQAIVKKLFAGKRDSVSSNTVGSGAYDVTVRDGTSVSTFRVQFSKMNLEGNYRDGEEVAGIKITYVGGN